MTKKHFQAVAEKIAKRAADARQLNDDAYLSVRCVALDLADVFEEQNPRFDRGKFLKACGVA